MLKTKESNSGASSRREDRSDPGIEPGSRHLQTYLDNESCRPEQIFRWWVEGNKEEAWIECGLRFQKRWALLASRAHLKFRGHVMRVSVLFFPVWVAKVQAQCTPRRNTSPRALGIFDALSFSKPLTTSNQFVRLGNLPTFKPSTSNSTPAIPRKWSRRGRTTAATSRDAATSSPSAAPTARDARPRTRPSRGSPSATWLSLPRLVSPRPDSQPQPQFPSLELLRAQHNWATKKKKNGANRNRRHSRGLGLRQ